MIPANAPQARYRLYTNLASYAGMLLDMVRGRMGQGPEIGEMETALARKFQVRYCRLAPMARTGIYLALKSLIRPGQEVVLSPYTIADVINMVICAGGTPVFADVEADSANIDPKEVEKRITRNTGAVIVTHLHGISADVHAVKDLCEAANIPLIEDAAQAFGAIIEGRRAGAIGDAGIYSFGTYKNLNAWFGGAVVTNREDVMASVSEALESLSFQTSTFVLKRMLKGGLTDIVTSPLIFRWLVYWIFRYGFLNEIKWINKKVEIETDLRRRDAVPGLYLARMTAAQARLALSQLPRVDQDNAARIQKAALYHQELKSLPDIRIAGDIKGRANIFTYFPIQYRDRRTLLKWLMRQRRDLAAQHLKNCADAPAFREFYRDCPNARAAADRMIILPAYPRYADTEVRKTAAAVRSFFQ